MLYPKPRTEINCYCENCRWVGNYDNLIRSEREWDFPPRCCPNCGEESIDEIKGTLRSLNADRAACLQQIENQANKPMYIQAQFSDALQARLGRIEREIRELEVVAA